MRKSEAVTTKRDVVVSRKEKEKEKEKEGFWVCYQNKVVEWS